MREEKTCSRCNKKKTIENFHNKSSDGWIGKQSICKLCVSKNNKKYYRANKDKIKNLQLKYFYDISSEEYQELLEEQNGVCAICLKPPKSNRMLCVDHCHKTNEVRGLLCDSCNTGLGNFKDRIVNLENAILYLKSFGKF